jgi:two-component system sensor histidine kinase RegB
MMGEKPLPPVGAATAAGWRGLWAQVAGRPGDDLVDPHRQDALNRRLLALLILARWTMTLTGIVSVWALWDPAAADFPWLRIAAMLLLVSGLSYSLHLRLQHDEPPTEALFVGHLLADIALLTFVFHQTGGVENPFLVFYMLPMTLAAYSLSWSRLLGVAAVLAGALVLLNRFHNDVPVFNELVHEVSELIAVAAITYFAYTVASLSRRHDRAVARAREDAINVRGAQALGSVAVRAADTISSPLATMSVLVYELQKGRLAPGEGQAALDVLAQQIALCKSNLSELLESVGHPRGERGERCGVDALIYAAARDCELMDPGLRVSFERIDPTPPDVVDERSLFDAFVLLIQHCGRDSPRTVRVALQWDAGEVVVAVCGGKPIGAPTAGQARNLAGRDETDASIALAASLIGRLGGSLAWTTRNQTRCLEARIPVLSTGLAPGLTASDSPVITIERPPS